MAREDLKFEILRLIAGHDGEWYWSQVDRALSGTHLGRVGPFRAEIEELAAEGLIEIEIRPHRAPGDQARYWVTDAGRRRAGRPIAATSGGESPMGVAERDRAGSWAVHRQDDHGNRFVVATGLDRGEAMRLASELEARGHKQRYWVEASPAPAPAPDLESVSSPTDGAAPA